MIVVALGVMAPFVDGLVTSGAFMADLAGTLEEVGVESLWTVEHVVVAESYAPRYPYAPSGRLSPQAPTTPMPDPLDTLAFVAGVSRSLRLGTAVVVAPLHSPAVLAKRAATVDRLSGGRLLLGLGIGWQREEYDAVGAPFSARGARLEDSVAAMRALWSSQPATYAGRFSTFERVYSLPAPTAGAVPVVLGGHSPAAVERAGRIADGWFPFTIGPAEFEVVVDDLRAAEAKAHRQEGSVAVTCWPGSAGDETAAAVRRYVAAGATRVVTRLPLDRPGDLAAAGEAAARFRDTALR